MSAEESGSRLSPTESTAIDMLIFIVWLIRAVIDSKHWKATVWFPALSDVSRLPLTSFESGKRLT